MRSVLLQISVNLLPCSSERLSETILPFSCWIWTRENVVLVAAKATLWPGGKPDLGCRWLWTSEQSQERAWVSIISIISLISATPKPTLSLDFLLYKWIFSLIQFKLVFCYCSLRYPDWHLLTQEIILQKLNHGMKYWCKQCLKTFFDKNQWAVHTSHQGHH